MRKIDVSEQPMPEINTAKVCFVIEKSRELLSEDVGIGSDASNSRDDGERVMLTDADAAGHSIRRELVEFIRDLDVDESAALVALAWIGRGDFEPDEWRSAVAEASDRRETPTWKYLLGMALLPDYLEDALSQFGRSCENFEARLGGGGVRRNLAHARTTAAPKVNKEGRSSREGRPVRWTARDQAQAFLSVSAARAAK